MLLPARLMLNAALVGIFAVLVVRLKARTHEIMTDACEVRCTVPATADQLERRLGLHAHIHQEPI